MKADFNHGVFLCYGEDFSSRKRNVEFFLPTAAAAWGPRSPVTLALPAPHEKFMPALALKP
jgi:hypothetical protein